ncbi:MAG: hypothetical protein FJX02_04910 [Alphaproteobacteria bacterium]|nr:hypothetical protein [Alphaproteobacteria bacterium]
MNRRGVLLAGVAAVAGVSAARAAPAVSVIYVGGWDCPPCTRWKNQHKADWQASALYKRVGYIEVDTPRLRDAYQERYWPGELAAILEQLPEKRGTPRFLVVRDGTLVANRFGASQWPAILEAVAEAVG